MRCIEEVRQLCHRFRELILYGIIGGFCAALDFGLYSLLGLFMPYLWANIISVHAGIFCSFFLNRLYNFKVTDRPVQRFSIFYLVGLSGLGLSELMLYLLVERAVWNPLLAKLLSAVVVALYQFVLNKFITFCPHHQQGPLKQICKTLPLYFFPFFRDSASKSRACRRAAMRLDLSLAYAKLKLIY